MSKKEIQNENSQFSRLASRLAEFKLTQPQTSSANSDEVSRLVSRLAEFKLTQERIPPQENTSTRDSSTQTFVPTAAQLAHIGAVMEFCAWYDGEPNPTPEQIYEATIKFYLYDEWW